MWRSEREGFLLLEDGSRFDGRVVSPGTRFGEVVFNTSMTGYQEILTDPSYRGQIVVMTQPHIGNYGVGAAAEESARPWVEGFLAHQFTRRASGGGEGALIEYLLRHEIPAVDALDTRAIVRRLRRCGALRGVVSSDVEDHDRLAGELARFPSMAGRALVDDVTCREPYELASEGPTRYRLAVYDFGIKTSILRSLRAAGARLWVLPARTPADDCLALPVDGVVLSNGPGDPEPLADIVASVQELVAAGRPMLGICLGHQLLGLALGGSTFKLKFGHHGGNQPVRELLSGKVSITSQNHGFALDPDSLPSSCRVTERNLNDDTVEAFDVVSRPILSVQYHPEGAPGPHDTAALFDRFLASLD